MSNDNNANDPLNFMKNMWGGMGFSLPGMVAPTFDVEEIEKRVKDMKAVEGWLKMNLSMLQMTIQGLEMQCATLNAVRTMGDMASNAANQQAAQGTPAFTPPGDGADATGQPAMWPWNLMQQMQEQMQQAAEEQQAAQPEAAKAETKRGKKNP